MAKLLIVGGTHGNEMSGIRLVEQWRHNGLPQHFDALNIECVLANTSAIEANRRFIEQDLNRQFTLARLNANDDSVENRLARVLNQRFGPKGHSQTDIVIDIHNTTSAMGATLILPSDDDWYLQLGRYVKQHMPSATILLENACDYLEHPYLCTLGTRGVMIEVGAQPQGLLRADVYRLTEEMLLHTLGYCQRDITHSLPALLPCEAYLLGDNVYFPVDKAGNVSAMIHPHLQDKDFQALMPGDPVFLGFDGKEWLWQEKTVTFPHFINEAAYRSQNVAFSMSTKITL